ncbi:MAG: nucleotidyltransferase, partial [Bacteroidales bacterium]|nr:nucleotidyltransferase [Bacteroidales bacterium]
VFLSFMAAFGDDPKKEFYIPYAIDTLINSGKAACDLVSTPSHWFGVTFKEDRPGVVAKFAELVADGVYPSPLYQ